MQALSGWLPALGFTDPRSTGTVLAVLALLFLGRVAGQVVVALRAPGWLPPMSEWYSGLLAYRRLLATQAVVLIVLWTVALGLLLDLPPFTARRPDLGTALVWLGWAYLLAMAMRYVVTMVRRPEARWFGRTIPIAFHIVLAIWIVVFGSFLRS